MASVLKKIVVGTPYTWSPAVFFEQGQQGAWYDPSDISTMYQDADGTIPVLSSGDRVGKMLDKSGNGNHLYQPDDSMRPTYRNYGATHWLDFDGVDDHLASDNVTFPYNNVELSAAIYPTSSAERGFIASVYNPDDLVGHIMYLEAPGADANKARYLCRLGNNGNPAGTDFTESTKYVISATSTETNNTLRLNGAVADSRDELYGDLDLPEAPITLGCRLPEQDRFYRGRIYGLLLRTPQSITSLDSREEYLSSRANMVI